MTVAILIVLFLILWAEFVNGWTDAPNAIATVVSTRVLAPRTAVALAVVMNILGALSGTAVAFALTRADNCPHRLEEARAVGALGFMARVLVQATLPHSRPHRGPNPHEFERINGRFTLYMNAPPSVGLPYGSYPRLALAWLSTEAVRTRSREIELGATFSSFMYKLGLTPITGKRGTTSRLRDQLHRLFSTTIRCSYQESGDWHGSGAGRDCLSPLSCAGVGYTIAHKHQLWWSPRDPEQRPLWSSVVVLSSEFYEELVAHAVPIDLRALRALKGSPLALDVYSWLTYRMSYLRKPCLIPWEALQTQFGADYGRPRDFKRKLLGHLGDVLLVYPQARISEQPAGLLLRPSPTHLPRRLAQ